MISLQAQPVWTPITHFILDIFDIFGVAAIISRTLRPRRGLPG
jgi:hypothetical protein